MRTRFHQALLVTASMLLVAPLQSIAQDSPLKHVPAKTPIIIQVRGIEKSKERLAKMLDNAIPNEAKMVSFLMDSGMQMLLKGRETKAIKKDEHVLVMINDLSTLMELPEIAVLVPVSSYADFRESFLTADEQKSIKKGDGFESVTVEGRDEPLCLIDIKSHVLVTSDRDVAKSMLKKFDSLEGNLSAETKKAFLDTDVALYVNLQALNDAYGATLKQFKGLIDLVLNMGGQGIDKKQMEMIKNFFEGFLQVFDDGKAAVMGIDFRPDGLGFKLMAQFQPKTDTSNFLQSLKLSKLESMGTLPASQMSYSAMRLDPKVSKALMAMINRTAVDDEDDTAKQAIEKATEELTEAGIEESVSSSSFPANALEVSRFKNPEKAVGATLKLMKALTKSGSFQSVPLMGKPEIKENAEEVGKFKLHSIQLAFDIEKALTDLPEGIKEATKSSMLRMLGGEKINIWFGTDGKTVVQLTAQDWKTAKAMLEQYIDGTKSVAKDEGFSLTRKNLPTETTLLTMVDGAQMVFMLVDMFKEIAQAVPGFPGALPQLKPVQGKPAYLGFTISLKPEHASIDAFVPGTAVQQIRKLLSPIIERDN